MLSFGFSGIALPCFRVNAALVQQEGSPGCEPAGKPRLLGSPELDPYLAALGSAGLSFHPEQSFLASLTPAPDVGFEGGTIGNRLQDVAWLQGKSFHGHFECRLRAREPFRVDRFYCHTYSFGCLQASQTSVTSLIGWSFKKLETGGPLLVTLSSYALERAGTTPPSQGSAAGIAQSI
jgi:hypothetical protein